MARGIISFSRNDAFLYFSPIFPLPGEMWISITMTIVIELVPVDLRTSCVALYLFIITNVGGNAPLLVTPIQNAFQRRGMNPQDSLTGKVLRLEFSSNIGYFFVEIEQPCLRTFIVSSSAVHLVSRPVCVGRSHVSGCGSCCET